MVDQAKFGTRSLHELPVVNYRSFSLFSCFRNVPVLLYIIHLLDRNINRIKNTWPAAQTLSTHASSGLSSGPTFVTLLPPIYSCAAGRISMTSLGERQAGDVLVAHEGSNYNAHGLRAKETQDLACRSNGSLRSQVADLWRRGYYAVL